MTRDLIIFQNIFLTVCVSLSGLGPSETHEKLSMRKMCDSSNEKQGEKLFLLWRHSALLVRPFSWLAKNRRQGNPCQYARDWSIRYGALCRSGSHGCYADRAAGHWVLGTWPTPEVRFPGNVQKFESLASRLRCGSAWIDRLLASISPGFKAISVTMGYRSGLLSSWPSVVAKEPCSKVAIEEEGVRECVWSSVVLA